MRMIDINLLREVLLAGQQPGQRVWALAAYRRVLGDDHPDNLTSMNNLAEVPSLAYGTTAIA